MQGFEEIRRIVIRDLFSSAAGLLPYTFYRRYRFNPSQIAEIVSVLIEEGLAYDDGVRIKLTPLGKKWVVDNRNSLIKHEKSWRTPPDEFVTTQVKVNEPYIPNTSLLDKEFFS